MNKEIIDELLPEELVEKEETLEDYEETNPPQKIVKFQDQPKPILKKEKGSSESYYELFGFEISKTTIYLFLTFIFCIIGYFIYEHFNKDKETEK